MLNTFSRSLIIWEPRYWNTNQGNERTGCLSSWTVPHLVNYTLTPGLPQVTMHRRCIVYRGEGRTEKKCTAAFKAFRHINVGRPMMSICMRCAYLYNKIVFQSKADHPQTGLHRHGFTLLWPWPWPDDLDIRT